MKSESIGREALRHEANAILAMADALGATFIQAVDLISAGKGRAITCGIGKSGHIARKTAGTFSSTGTPSLFLHAAEAVHGDLGMVTANDVVVLYTHSGETEEIVKLFAPIASIGARTILITGRPESTAGRLADVVLDTGVADEACPNNLAPTTSTTAMIALSDALAIAVMVRRGFTREDFARFHPSGSLGKRLLLRVSDVMRPAREIAVVSPETPFLEILKAITKAGVGAACVCDPEGRLLGFISDGDCRRFMLREDFDMAAPGSKIMNPCDYSIEPTLMAVDALEYFQQLERKIGEMPVLQGDRLVGLLMLKDLLRSGIV